MNIPQRAHNARIPNTNAEGGLFLCAVWSMRRLFPLEKLIIQANCDRLCYPSQAKRALREMAQATFCADIRQLLRAVSVVMAADEGRQGLEDGSANRNFADITEGANFPLSEVSVLHAQHVSRKIRSHPRLHEFLSWKLSTRPTPPGSKFRCRGSGHGRPSFPTTRITSSPLQSWRSPFSKPTFLVSGQG